MSLLAELNNQGIGIILVTHDMELLLAHTDRAVVLHQGELVFDGPTEKLFEGAGHDVAAWGLRVPDAAAVAGKLSMEMDPVCSVEELVEGIQQHLRSETDEKTGATV